MRVIGDPGTVSSYSTPTALSATGKYVALELSGTSEIVRAISGQPVRTVDMSQSWGFWWSPSDDEVYFRTDRERPVIIRGHVATGKEQVVLDPRPAVSKIQTGGTGDPSRDGWLPFWSAPEGKVCLAPLDGSGKLWCITNVPDVNVGDIDFILISKAVDVKTGKRYLVVENPGVVLSFDETTGLKYEYTAPEHPDARIWKWGDGTPMGNGNGVCELNKREWCVGAYWDHADTVDIDGEQFIFATMEDEDLEGNGGSFVGVWRLSAGPAWLLKPWPQGGERRLLSLRRGTGFGGVGERHFGCAVNVPVCLISTNAYVRSKDDNRPWPPMVYGGEFMLFRWLADESYTIHRIAKHRSVQFTEHGADYYSMTRASICANAGFVAGTTNFGFYPPDNHPGGGQRHQTDDRGDHWTGQ